MDASLRTLVPLESVAKMVEGDGQVLRAAQGCELTIWWRVGDQASVDEPTDKRVDPVSSGFVVEVNLDMSTFIQLNACSPPVLIHLC